MSPALASILERLTHPAADPLERIEVRLGEALAELADLEHAPAKQVRAGLPKVEAELQAAVEVLAELRELLGVLPR